MGMSLTLKYLSIVLVTAVVVGGGTYFLTNSKADSDRNDLQAQVSGANAKLATAQIVPTNDWKTYTNHGQGYSIKYPTDWATEDSDVCTPSATAAQYTCAQYIASYQYTAMARPTMADLIKANQKDAPDGAIISINVFSNPKELALTDYVTGSSGLNHSDSALYPEQNVTINGNTFLKEDGSDSPSYYIGKGNKVFWLSWTLYDKSDGQIQISASESNHFEADFNAMLKTFNFFK